MQSNPPKPSSIECVFKPEPKHPLSVPFSLLSKQNMSPSEGPSGRSGSNRQPPASPQNEYESGRVSCICGEAISFRDQYTGEFTLHHWDTHRQQCSLSQQRAEAMAHRYEAAHEAPKRAQAKRRRAKRTEAERIDYLRSDPYVAQFEAFRVHCAICHRWIRLRPNSTYCSIPWDAHRKSCLSKKINKKNTCALDERNALLSKDQNIREFHAERILCNVCSRWLDVSPVDHIQAVQVWLQHRAYCHKPASASVQSDVHQPPPVWQRRPERVCTPPPPPPPRQFHRPPPSEDSEPSCSLPPINTFPPAQPESRARFSPALRDSCPHDDEHHPHDDDDGDDGRPGWLARARSSSPDPRRCAFSPTRPVPGPLRAAHEVASPTFPAPQEPRRRTAEQRAATLRSDPLAAQVEPGRIFCSLCRKWVRLRQDSSYCAYPWLQHREKCLIRFRKSQERFKGTQERTGTSLDDILNLDSDVPSDGEPASGPAFGDHSFGRQFEKPDEDRRVHTTAPSKLSMDVHERRHHHAPPMHWHGGRSESVGHAGGPHSTGPTTSHSAGSGGASQSPHHHRRVRSESTRVADLDTVPGRRKFVLASIHYLFSTTYEVSDEMTVSALLPFLNTAMPPDKHEDFDTSELVKAAAALHEQGQVLFEGDTLRRVHSAA